LWLRSTGMRRGDRVAIVAARGWEQVVAVVGVLLAGGAYVPVDVAQPRIRRDTVLADAGIRQVLTQEALVGAPADWPTGVERIAVDALEPVAARPAPGAGRDGVDPADPAYVIYTSGSTGTPKGAILSHHAAHNTLVDIRERFGVGPDDRVLALAGLGFDLSVFDVLGVLGAGGAMVLPDPRRRDDPSHWAALIARHRVTLWNSVPAQARMLQDYRDAVAATGGSPGGPTAGDAPSTLRLALLSGDWIPVTLPDAMRAGHPELTVVSLGGATEAAIWSVHHVIGEVDRLLPSIPYGTPLRGQRLAVVDHLARDRPEGVPGEILIRGAGVALGYIGDAERTRERFGVDPATGDREYRTGDIGRYLPDGSIELLGREDAQVKIRGYRIELAEIQAAVLAHPGVADCAVQVAEGTAGRHLVGLVQPERIAPVDAPEDHAPGDAARAALQLAAADVDTDALGAFLAQFDEHALRVIERTLATAGALVDRGSPVTADEVAGLLRASDAHRVVVRRWLRALE
ncbi:amino acid adenylation domain-containing protein, partial [Clavibacter michiganensis]|uniref:amino acid adenylation domain-containing protein n=1 Tax=Clavibacter michiganensis TaxID=28447 RepID=UPI00117D98BC